MNNYNIITLGSSGSGKTIFLASLFKVFSTQGKFGFSLDVKDPNKRKFLNQIYADLAQKEEEWPSGTRNISEWSFTAYVNNSGTSRIPACKITYVDYKGGLITDISDDEGIGSDFDNLETYLEEADAVLVILDGQKLLAFMQNHSSNNENKIVSRWLHQDLPNLMQMVDECNKHTPVHFIISKWDLLEGSYSLINVKKHLLKDVPEFNNVVQSRRKVGCPVRLIPVSSLGKGFAVLQPDGQMKKLSGNPHPMNIEVPLAFALTEKLQNQTDRPKQKPFKLTIWDWAIIVLIVFCLITTFYRVGIVVAIVYFGFRLLTNNKKRNERQSNSTLSNEDAFGRILSSLQEIQKQFNTNFPGSDLAKIPSLNSR